MMRRRTSVAAAALAVLAVATRAVPPVENFEKDTVPPGWQAGGGSELAVVSERFKSGERSLRWSWSGPGAVLCCRLPGGAMPAPNGQGLALWLYNEKPAERILRLELLRNGAVAGRCWYVLNFRGWRPLGAPYAEVVAEPAAGVANGAPPRAVDGFRWSLAPGPEGAGGTESGRLYFDYVNFACRDRLRADHQQPWVGRPDILATTTPERFIYSSRDLALNRPWLRDLALKTSVSAEERKDMATIRGRFLLPAACTPRKDPSALDDFRTVCRIRRSPEGVLTGRPIVPPWGGFNCPPDGMILYDRLNPARPPATGAGGIHFDKPQRVVGLSPVGASMLQRLGEAYVHELRTGNADGAAKLKDAFFDLCDHMLDQGFAEGNANASSWCFPTGPLMGMRRELEATGRLRDMLLACLAFGTSYSDGVLAIEDWRRPDFLGDPRNTDGFGNYTELLWFILLLPDEAERAQRLHAFSRAVSLLCDPQLGEPYAWDGTCHHHMMFHPGYSAGALIPQALQLKDTCFRLTPDALETMKRSVMMLGFMSDARGIIPPNCPGYTGVPLGVYARPETLGQFAAVGTAGSRNGIDPDIAGVYVAFHAGATNPPARVGELQALGFGPYRPVGHLSVNGASIALHRRDDWLVAIAGKYRFRRGLEPNYTGSLFNHYARNGSVFVVSGGSPVSIWASGYSLEGWDARHYPGATCYLGEDPAELLCRSRGHTEDAFAGGTALDGDGIWGMVSSGQTNPALTRSGNIAFRKSAFCFGNRITLVTTGIGRGALADAAERRLELATTLWQNAFGAGGQVGDQNLRLGFNTPRKPPPPPPADEPCWIGDTPVSDFPWTTNLPSGPACRLVDNKHTGYYVPPGSPPIRIERRHQLWTYPSAYFRKPGTTNASPSDLRIFTPTEGDFAVAWFGHGARPDAAECTYTLIPRTTPADMARFAAAMAGDDPPYRFLQRDARAHVLCDRDSRTTGYVVFDAAWTSPATVLRAVNRPCTVMVRETAEGLRVSVASTDMDSWLREIRVSGEIVLSLAGRWALYGGRPDCTAAPGPETTVLRIPFKDFLPAVLTLRRAAGG